VHLYATQHVKLLIEVLSSEMLAIVIWILRIIFITLSIVFGVWNIVCGYSFRTYSTLHIAQQLSNISLIQRVQYKLNCPFNGDQPEAALLDL
jgi:hypothetical protein